MWEHRGPGEATMQHGDHVEITGKEDEVYVFLTEVQGTATLRWAGKGGHEPTLAIPIDDVVSLEQTNLICPHPSGY
jgi:hypothetical protein